MLFGCDDVVDVVREEQGEERLEALGNNAMAIYLDYLYECSQGGA